MEIVQRQVQVYPEALASRSDTVKEQDHLSLHAPVDQELSGGDLNPPGEELKSCNSENRHAANQVSSGYIIKETANQSLVTSLFHRMQSYEKTSSRKRSTSIISGSGTSSSKKRKLFAECKIQFDGLDVDNKVIDEIVCQKVTTQACKPRPPPPILENLTKTCTKFWVTGSKNDLAIKNQNLIVKFLQSVKNSTLLL